MKNSAWFFALAAALATLGYVAFRAFAHPAAAVSAAPLELQNREVARVIGDLTNAAENVDNAMKSAPSSLPKRSGAEVTELIRLVGELARANAAQQETIHQLTAAPQKSGGMLESVVTLVGIGSTLLTMLLAWRKDRREIAELKAKLASSPVAA